MAASETCTDARVSSAVCCPGVRSFHLVLFRQVLFLDPVRVMVILPVLGDSEFRRPLRGRPVALMLVRAPPAVNARPARTTHGAASDADVGPQDAERHRPAGDPGQGQGQGQPIFG